MSYPNLFIISGPSGSGEDSIIEGLKKYFPVERVVTTTTRAARPGETHGISYYFTTREDFERRLNNNEFVEHARQYNGNLYGVTREELDRVVQSGKAGVWKIEYQGVISAKKLFPEIIAIFITVPEFSILETRIRRRDRVSEDYIKERMIYSKEWMRHADIYDYTVVNEEGKLDKAVREVADIIKRHEKSNQTNPKRIISELSVSEKF